jgi:hypothetical protein
MYSSKRPSLILAGLRDAHPSRRPRSGRPQECTGDSVVGSPGRRPDSGPWKSPRRRQILRSHARGIEPILAVAPTGGHGVTLSPWNLADGGSKEGEGATP